MFGSNFIELGIALSFLFLLLSLMCSLLSETFSKYLSWRAEMLEVSIRQLLRDVDIAGHFYRHPVIKSMGMEGRPFDKGRLLDAAGGPRWPRSWATWLSRKLDLVTMPSYIKSTTFSRIVLEIIVLMPRLELIKELRAEIARCKSLSGEERPDAILADINAAEFDTADAFCQRIDAIGGLIGAKVKDEAERAALLGIIKRLKPEAAPPPPKDAPVEGQAPAAPPTGTKSRALVEVMAAIGKLKNGETRRIFESLIGGDEVTEIAQAQILVGRYFDDVQERASGWYKRRSQRTIFIIGLTLALILNANTLIIADKLLRDNSVRALVVAAAEGNSDKFRPVSEPAGAPPASVAAPSANSTPAGPAPSSAPSAPGAGQAGAAAPATLQDLKQEIDKLTLPTGWPERPAPIALATFPTTMAYVYEFRFACAEAAGAQAAAAKKSEAAALELRSRAKARLEATKTEAVKLADELRRARTGAAQPDAKNAEKLSAAEAATEAAKKEAEAVENVVAAAVVASGSAADLAAQMKAELERSKLGAIKAKGDADKRMEQAEKVLAEFANNPRSCPDFVCGERTWGDQWPYYLKKSVLWFLAMAVGWLVTALAASLGAQFWFDVIGKIMHIRTSKKPEEVQATPPAAQPSTAQPSTAQPSTARPPARS